VLVKLDTSTLTDEPGGHRDADAGVGPRPHPGIHRHLHREITPRPRTLPRNQVYYAAAVPSTDGVDGPAFAVVCLVKWNPRDKEGYVFGYKDSAPLWR
jgi:hypothetical protein